MVSVHSEIFYNTKFIQLLDEEEDECIEEDCLDCEDIENFEQSSNSAIDNGL